MTWRVDVGDCVDLMAAMPACSVDAVVCDPPYGLEFMGKDWDRLWDKRQERQFRSEGRNAPKFRTSQINEYRAGIVSQEWHHRWASEALRVLKPGGHLLAFGGTRTSHRLACAIEDAGFEIRDTICWLYGSGFPKSLDVGKAIDKAAGAEREQVPATGGLHKNERLNDDGWAKIGDSNALMDSAMPATPDAERWDGWGTALKPAHEPIVMARKPLAGTVAANVLEHGTGALNVDGCRVGSEQIRSRKDGGFGANFMDDDWKPETLTPYREHEGRWPANVALDEQAAAMLDEQSGPAGSNSMTSGPPATDGFLGGIGNNRHLDTRDSGGASRFFYIAKASRAERNAGLDGFPLQPDKKYDGGEFINGNGTPSSQLTARNHHPTVKPVSLMRWLCRLVTPPDGLILDPFTGSGTTGIAAVLEGFNFLGCEQDEAYADIAQARIGWWELHGHDALRIVAEQEAAENERNEIRASGQMELL